MSTFGADVDVARMLTDAHRQIHDGNAFHFAEVLSLGSAAIGSYVLTAPSTTKQAHLSVAAQGFFGFTYDLYKGGDRTAGAAVTAVNRNGNSDTAAGLSISKAGTVGTTDGTKIDTRVAGAAAVAGALAIGSRTDDEWVLDQGVQYVLKLTSAAAANSVSVQLGWYEATP